MSMPGGPDATHSDVLTDTTLITIYANVREYHLALQLHQAHQALFLAQIFSAAVHCS